MLTQPPSWRDVFDLIIRLLPAASILVAVWLANRQLKAARRATAVTIAKNHYRELLEQFIVNADVVFVGTTLDGLSEIKKDPIAYRRYRWLTNLTLFSLQEIYFAIPDEKNWRNTVSIIPTIFKQFILSETELPPFIRAGWHPDFLSFVERSLATADHPILNIAAAEGDPALHMMLVSGSGARQPTPANGQTVGMP